ncbi:MAG: PAS domain-containing protein [Campylobacterales bacterium]|nr:PAS domain-containing protein [Campylobacterales bacterium]
MAYKSLSKADAPKNPNNNEKKLSKDDFIVSKTDTKGKIIYCNQIFASMAGYSASDLIGSNHNVIRHPDMPKVAFKLAWELIQNKKEFFGFVKNLCADGGYYWVFTYITADIDPKSGEILSYTSVRRKPSESAIEQIIPIYKTLVDAERLGGIAASQKILNNLLDEHHISYDEFVINLQKGARI